MKSTFLLFILLFTGTFSFAQSNNPNLDTALVKKLGADDYGMKRYVFVLLKTGENKTTNKKFIDSCFAGHMANIGKLSDQNKLVVAGPFGKNNKEFRGIFILNVATIEEASQLLDGDPAIKEKLLSAELVPWYGSAAISEYLKFHDKIWKVNP